MADLQEALEILYSNGFHVCRSDAEYLDVPLCENADDADEESRGALWVNIFGALSCVCLAAMAAGLTLGLLGLDPLALLIKERAGANEEERRMASSLLPLVKQHHRLLVTLLLMNSIANEALPIFLESLVPPSVAILMSVTLVLFFGEIIPSAVFTGPNQLRIASGLVPVVKFFLLLLSPIAVPIATMLDWLLHDEDDDKAYNRGELSALIRINYENRLAAKRHRKAEAATLLGGSHVGALDFTNNIDHRMSLRATKSQLNREPIPMLDGRPDFQRAPSIHMDEVTMVEGALQMQTKVAMDVFTPKRRLFSIPQEMQLIESNLVKIYAAGFTRVPVHETGDKYAIIGILMTKQLIVVDPKDQRIVGTLPLRRPRCVSPSMPLVHLVNLFQTGGDAVQGGHLALVCVNPRLANESLAAGEAISEEAGFMGVITLEDVIEALLQEQIYDEMDRKERETTRLAKMVTRQWKNFVMRKKAGISMTTNVPSMLPIVHSAVRANQGGPVSESTSLLH